MIVGCVAEFGGAMAEGEDGACAGIVAWRTPSPPGKMWINGLKELFLNDLAWKLK